ncbi:polymorphic toxin-type HINT domain-containing protein [Kitasatospora sp. NPDC094015]|uniref:polymorphic toxin-type HINT domain-containing protein n=1 Tax=Kitasatospora sp. NPDC094015 TaxID=3155205 RepID=UPI003329BE1C
MNVQVADRNQAKSADVDGLLVGLGRADGGPGADNVAVSLDYSSIEQAYGGGWASRLHLVRMPSCALTTPEVAACRVQQPMEFTNDPLTRRITGTVALTGTAPRARSALAAPRAPAAAPGGTAVAAVAGTGGSQGDYTATSLSAAGAWSASAAGSFTYSYPVTAPPSLAGDGPTVSLSYDSQSIDGETSARNSQSSWIGDGWSYSPGFIERSYKPCANSGIKDSGDECWAGWNATLSLGSHSGQLVRDGAGVYHLQTDDGTKIERLTGASNGLWDGEYFKVTTTDGTSYYLGLNHAPGTTSDSATNSAWGVPVYHPNSGDPCYSAAKGSASQCDKQPGYRFNLDFIVDPNGNVQRYDWANESNYYNMGYGQVVQSGAGGTLTAYTRGGYLTQISYGYQLADAVAGREPSAKVVFNTAQRCTASDAVCQYGNLSKATATNWQDSPYDLNCPSTYKTSGTGDDVCQVAAPTFWSTYRLKSIDTRIRTGAGWQDVDTYDLTHVFSDAGGTMDPVTGKTQDPKNVGALQAVMWLQSVRHTGKDTTAGGADSIALDPVTFTGIEMDNRVDGLTPAAPPLYHPRISSVQTETGASIAVTYRDPECSRVKGTMPASADSNTMACYPVYWNTPGAKDPIADWFNKTLVTQITSSDRTKAGSPAQVVKYDYSGGTAWHRDDSELTDDKYRTWNDFRGYRTVTTTSGSAPDPVTQSTVSYLRGMDGDFKADGARRSVKLANSLGEQITDSPWLAGAAQESASYTQAGGSVTGKSLIDEPTVVPVTSTPRTAWTSEVPAPAHLSTLPDLIAHRAESASARSLGLLSDGVTWRTTQDRTSFDGLGRVSQVDSKGDVTVPSQETCTTTKYAAAPAGNPMMLGYPSEIVTVAGPCTTSAGSTTTINDSRVFYDGDGTVTNPGTPGTLGQNGTTLGLATSNQILTGYDGSGAPQFQTTGAVAYDGYGRVVKSLDLGGLATTTTYSPVTSVLPTSFSTTNPMGWTASSTIAPARGLVTKAVDANGKVTESTYDTLGRRAAVWTPGRDKATQSPDRKFSYSVHGAGDNPDPTTVTTQTLLEGGLYNTAVTLYDGFLQARQGQSTRPDNGAGRLISSSFYDSHGWNVRSIAPYVDTTTAPGTTLWAETNQTGPSVTQTGYDGQGRAVTGALRSFADVLWQSATTYKGVDRVDTTPPEGGTATTTYVDALGRTTSTVARDSTPDRQLPGGTTITAGTSVLSRSVRLSMQADGNLVLNGIADGKALWSTSTAGHPGASAKVTADGNLVVLDTNGTTQLWSSNSGTHTGGYLKVQGDANLALYDAANTKVWASNTANSAAAADITTMYTYTPGSQLDTVKDNAGNTWSYGYDLQGQLTSKTDPDSGLSRTTYDRYGRVATTTDARNQSLAFSYDLAGRRVGEYSGTGTTDSSKLLAEWSYDQKYKGLIDSSTRYVGGKTGSAYTKTVDSYNANYQPTSVTTTIPVDEGKLAGSYTAKTDYTKDVGWLGSTTYGSEGGLPAETVGYGYNAQGLLIGAGSDSTKYAGPVAYSPLGQVLQTTVGMPGKQLRTNRTYDQATGRLATNKVTLQTNTANPISNLTYGYDQAGNPTTITDTQSSGGTDRTTDTQCFGYDAQNRLTTAWTDSNGITAVTAGQLARCVTTRPTAASIGGPAPYWLDWQYNQLGDRNQQVQHDITGNAAKNTTQSSTYPGAGTAVAAQPNTATSITTTNPTTGTTTLTPHYDPAGNTTGRDTTGSKTGSQAFTYNEEGRTDTVTTNGAPTKYIYDADGGLLVQRGPASGSNVLYLFGGAEQLTLNNTTKVVTGQRYYSSPDGTAIVRSSNGTVSYQPTTAQGTAQLQVDGSTLAITRRNFDPYGNVRGTPPNAWADNHGYLGRPTDATTGLSLLGARNYDPAIGRFLTVDPVFEAGDPDQMGGYAYAANNPVSGSDPTGLIANRLDKSGGDAPPPQGDFRDAIGGIVDELASLDNSATEFINPGLAPFKKKFTSFISDTVSKHLKVRKNTSQYEAGKVLVEASTLVVSPEVEVEGGLSVFARRVVAKIGSKFRGLLTKAAEDGGEAATKAFDDSLRLGKTDKPATPKGDDPHPPSDPSPPAEPAAEPSSPGEGAGGGGHEPEPATCSFTPDTPVLMADGTAKPIGDLSEGDQVEAADQSHVENQAAQTVTAKLVHTDEDLVDVTTKDASGAESTLHTTARHPFWDETTGSWTPASDLVAGHSLRSADGTQVEITSVLAIHGTKAMYNLTVANYHTYYVLAGTTPVLVHNECGPSELDAIGARGRAEELQGMRTDYPHADQKGTTAVIGVFNTETKTWVNRIAFEGSGGMPSNWILRPGEEFVPGRGHAEETILDNLGPNEIVGYGGTSRNICWDICYGRLDSRNLVFGGAGYRGGNADKSPFTLFWSEGW